MANFLVVEQNDSDFINFVDFISTSKLNDNICVFRATSFEEVLSEFSSDEFELVFVDVTLGNGNGLHHIESLKSIFPKSSIILLTPTDSEVTGLEAIRHGAIDYLAKDKLTFDTLNRAIRYSLERNKLKNSINEHQAQLAYSAKIASMGEMVRSVVHQINNPLAVIRASLHQLNKKLANIENFETEAITRCDQSVTRISTILDGLKLFSSSEDPVNLEESMAILDESIKATCNLCSERFKANGVKFIIPQIIPKFRIHIEQRHFMQVLLSLINNARESVISDESPWIEIEIEYTESSIEVSVIDSGPGVPKNLHKKIMDPFFTTKSLKNSTGLGLSIAKGILESYGGQLRLRPDANHTTFSFTVPHANKSKISKEKVA